MMKLSLATLLLSIFSLHGKDAQRYQFAHMVSIHHVGWNPPHSCGAAVLTPNWLVSAAHCFDSSASYVAVAGLLNQNETHPDNQRVPVAKIVTHPHFNVPYNDVAVAKLANPLVFTEAVQPIRLPKRGDIFNGNVWLSGWGRNYGGDNWELPNRLQCLEMPIINNQECNKILKENGSKYPFEIVDEMICTLPRKPKESACSGDSGGPLVQNGILVGITNSVGGSCNDLLPESSPNVFMRVSSYLDFITENVDDLA